MPALALHREGLRLASWTRRGFDTRERDPSRVMARLTRSLAGGDILLLHDGHAASRVALDVLPRLLRRCRELGLAPVTLLHALTRRGAPVRAGTAREAAA